MDRSWSPISYCRNLWFALTLAYLALWLTSRSLLRIRPSRQAGICESKALHPLKPTPGKRRWTWHSLHQMSLTINMTKNMSPRHIVGNGMNQIKLRGYDWPPVPPGSNIAVLPGYVYASTQKTGGGAMFFNRVIQALLDKALGINPVCQTFMMWAIVFS
jgi:hypothetical protein